MNTIETMGSSGSEKDLTDNECGHTDPSSASVSQPQSTTGSSGSGGDCGHAGVPHHTGSTTAHVASSSQPLASVQPPQQTNPQSHIASQPQTHSAQVVHPTVPANAQPINLVLRMR
jgi:hypothetical protein